MLKIENSIFAIAKTLARQGVFLVNTNHLTNLQLHERLSNIVVFHGDQITRSSGEISYIDLVGQDSDYDDYLAYYSTVGERAAHKIRTGEQIQLCPFVSDRDKTLPKPSTEKSY